MNLLSLLLPGFDGIGGILDEFPTLTSSKNYEDYVYKATRAQAGEAAGRVRRILSNVDSKCRFILRLGDRPSAWQMAVSHMSGGFLQGVGEPVTARLSDESEDLVIILNCPDPGSVVYGDGKRRAAVVECIVASLDVTDFSSTV